MALLLRRDSRGADVQQLQAFLNQRLVPSPGLETDGEFGPRTESAVRLYQATVGLGIDGEVGERTWKALRTGLVVKPPTPSLPGSYPDASWMAVASREIGQKEVRGAHHNPRIVEYHSTTSLRASSDETAWCSSFVNWCLRQAGQTGTNSAAAASWLTWGKATNARVGAVTVIYNAKAAKSSLSVSGNHVAFLVRDSCDHYLLLGGNQSNQVKVSSFPKASWQLKGYRWPGN